jgi:hypothetical protein
MEPCKESAMHSCCFCHKVILLGEDRVFIEGRGLHAHRACQRQVTDAAEPPPVAPFETQAPGAAPLIRRTGAV